MPNIEKRRLDIKRDNRGWVMEILRGSQLQMPDFGQIYLSVAKHGAVKGNHYHKKKTEWFCVIKGKGELLLMDVMSEEKIRMVLSDTDMQCIKIPQNTFHAIKNIGKGDMYLLAYIDKEYNPAEPDTYYDVNVE